MSRSDPEFVCLCVYQWSGERGQNIQTRQCFRQTIARSGRSISKGLRSNANPEGVNWSQLLSTKCSHKVIWNYQSTSKRKQKDMALRNAILLGLKNPNVYQKIRTRSRRNELFRLPLSFTTVIAKDRLCSLSVRQRRQLQPSNKGQRNYTANEALKRRKIDRRANKGKTPKPKEQEGANRQSCFCCGATPAHPKSECTAKEVACYRCDRKGHYPKCCKSKMAKPGRTVEH